MIGSSPLIGPPSLPFRLLDYCQSYFWVFYVKHGAGTTNTGNVARIFFANPKESAKILKISPEIIELFSDLLHDLNTTSYRADPAEFQEKADRLLMLLSTGRWQKVKQAQTVHRILVHGASTIAHFSYPVGSLSESAVEARNKFNKSARVGHARLSSFEKNTMDVFHFLALKSDPYLYCKRNSI